MPYEKTEPVATAENQIELYDYKKAYENSAALQVAVIPELPSKNVFKQQWHQPDLLRRSSRS